MKLSVAAIAAALLAVLAAAQSQDQSCLAAQTIAVGTTETTTNKDVPKVHVRLNHVTYEIQGLWAIACLKNAVWGSCI